jgi:hypothetical protein
VASASGRLDDSEEWGTVDEVSRRLAMSPAWFRQMAKHRADGPNETLIRPVVLTNVVEEDVRRGRLGFLDKRGEVRGREWVFRFRDDVQTFCAACAYFLPRPTSDLSR